MERGFDIGAWLQAETGGTALIGRALAARCRDAIEEQLRLTAEGAVTTLDGRQLSGVDVTAADERFAKLTLRVQGGEYGDRYTILLGLTADQEENVSVALQRKKLVMLIQRKGGPGIMGFLDPYLRSAFAYVKDAGWPPRVSWLSMRPRGSAWPPRNCCPSGKSKSSSARVSRSPLAACNMSIASLKATYGGKPHDARMAGHYRHRGDAPAVSDRAPH